MKDFYQWAEDHNLDLNLVLDTEGENTTSENRIRTGIRFGYPDAYAAGQYPDAYFPPYSASAPVDLKNRKKGK